MSYPEIIFIVSSNNPSPLLQRSAIVSRLILDKNHKKCRVIGQSATSPTGCKGIKNGSKCPENKAFVRQPMSPTSRHSRRRPNDELTAIKRRFMQIYAAFTGVRNVLRQLPCDNMSHAARTQTCPASRSLHKMPTNKNAPAFLEEGRGVDGLQLRLCPGDYGRCPVAPGSP